MGNTGHKSLAVDTLLPSSDERLKLLNQAVNQINDYYDRLPAARVVPDVDQATIHRYLEKFTFDHELDASVLIAEISDRIERWTLHVAHPRYFGLFNPTPSLQGIVADLLVAGYNCQLGAWHHSPIGVEIEAHLVRFFAGRFGLPETAFGHFTSGGSEANFTAVLVALSRLFPTFAKNGLRSLEGQPVLYCSTEFHHSFEKIARQCGLGGKAVRLVPVTADYVMDVDELDSMIQMDLTNGMLPFLINATGGTTNAGLVEPIDKIATIALKHQLHLHVDAAWGGSIVLSDKHKAELAGIEHADSITFDPHKLLSVPMGAGIVIVREQQWLEDTFGLKTDYVPEGETVRLDGYRNSIQFSRRFIGLKLFMTLATIGREQYAKIIDHQLAMAELLAEKLKAAGFLIKNGASLGVVCFVPPDHWNVSSHDQFETIAERIRKTGDAWISTTRLGGQSVLRACITSHLTQPSDLERLVELLLQAKGV